jgi:DNA (cytosine-5)-methyltransferase 1
LKNSIIQKTQKLLRGSELDILYATPPCQGMSKNGRGTLLNNARKGLRPKLDERNQLIVEVIEVAKILRPRMVLFENVPEMLDTIIETPDGSYELILDYIKKTLGDDYVGRGEVVEFADYGVPQKRQRLITVFSRENQAKSLFRQTKSFLPKTTHAAKPHNGTNKWVSLRDTIGQIEPLDAQSLRSAQSKNLPFHRVPLLDEEKYFWVSNTPSEKGAFDNQCVACGYDKNPTHGSRFDENGINRAKTDTPIRCLKCHALLPRPWVKQNGEYRLMKGFTSAYRRMSWDTPANALTTNLSYACSDNKLHPSQNRVLSLHEAFILHTVSDFQFDWQRADGKPLSDKTIREIVGESIPPKGLSVIVSHLAQILSKTDIDELVNSQLVDSQLEMAFFSKFFNSLPEGDEFFFHNFRGSKTHTLQTIRQRTMSHI